MSIRPVIAVMLAFAGAAFVVVEAAGPPSGEPDVLPAGTIQHAQDSLVWMDAPAPMPAGAKIMVLEGNPKAEGLFTIRLKIPADTRLPPHWHPREERVTVLSGRIAVGFGNHFDKSRLHYFGPGSYYVNPAHSHHFVYFPVATVAQITGMGPWQTQLLAGSKE